MKDPQLWTRLIAFVGVMIVVLRQFGARIDGRFDAVDGRFDAVDRRFDEVDRRFEQRLAHFEQVMNERFDHQDAVMNERFDHQAALMDVRFTSLEHRVPRSRTTCCWSRLT